MKVSHLKY